MQIDPRIGMYFSIVLAILGFLAGAGATLTDLFGDHTTKIILGIDVLALGVGNAINAVLHAIPSAPGAKQFLLGPSNTQPPKE